ncbi:MAG: hypothetical protein IJL69_01675 [Oscillospiraceae bacterium]|jgi:hypothetical protein|nr:hypothetical protein [Oscillospiraceae bacterium]
MENKRGEDLDGAPARASLPARVGGTLCRIAFCALLGLMSGGTLLIVLYTFFGKGLPG